MSHSVRRILRWTSTSLRSRRRDSTMKAMTKKRSSHRSKECEHQKYRKENSFIWRLRHVPRSMEEVTQNLRKSFVIIHSILGNKKRLWRLHYLRTVQGTNFSKQCVDSKQRTQQVLHNRKRLQTSFFRWQWRKSESLTSRICTLTGNRWRKCSITYA